MSKSPLIYAFAPREKIREGAPRVLGAIEGEVRRLAVRSSRPVAESIHDERVLIKRTRALLWFIRPALTRWTWRRARAQLRKASALLASRRDRRVMRSTLEKLSRKSSPKEDRKAVSEMGRKLGADSGADRALEKSAALFLGALDELARRAAQAGEGPDRSKRLGKAFHAMRKAGKLARRTGRDADYHAWRKKAKRLFYLLELTHPDPDGRAIYAIKRIHQLQDKLGAEHDCVVVGEGLPRTGAGARVRHLLEKRKVRLRRKAGRMARRLKKISVIRRS